MKKFLSLLLCSVLIATCFVAVACNTTNVKAFLHNYDDSGLTKQILYDEDTVLPTPTREGYNFEGWFTDEACTQPFVQGTEKTSNFHLYAKWTAKGSSTVTHSVTFVYNDGKTDNLVVTVNHGDVVTLPTPDVRTGYLFNGWYTSQQNGTQWVQTTPVNENITLYAHWVATGTQGGGGGSGSETHTQHDFGDSYFMYVKCSGCDVYGRNEGTRTHDNEFNFNDSKSVEISNHLDAAKTALNGNVADFVTAFRTFEEDVEYLDGQYGWAMVYYDCFSSMTDAIYSSVKSCYNEMFAEYCQLIVDANKKYSDDFWTLYKADKESTLQMAEMYANASSDGTVDEILEEYYALMNSYYVDTDDINKLYGRLVEAYNAEADGYHYDNHMTYAYDVIYNREYNEEKVKTMRQYIKQYIVPLYLEVGKAYDSYLVWEDGEYYLNIEDDDDFYFYVGMCELPIFENSDFEEYEAEIQATVNYIGDYFKWLDNANDATNKVTEKPVGFSKAVNDMFKTGTYFLGDSVYGGAYTTWIANSNLPVCYFTQSDYWSDDIGYDTAFTFVHEFGHYYENIHNGNVMLSYDHDETQSQGDEMLFLAWLEQNQNVLATLSEGMNFVSLTQLYTMLDTIISAAVVDEFEWAAYKGEVTDGDYNAKYLSILQSYLGSDVENDGYWYQVAFDSDAYYVSYAISALPAVEIYATAKKDLNIAREKYLKLFGYCEDEDRMNAYTYTGVGGVLEYCQLGNPFDEQLYKDIETNVSKVLN